MKHLYELHPRVIEKILSRSFSITEKLDGSFMRVGLDDEGRFYSSRKGNAVYYSVDDWPALPWTNAFRSAHVAMEHFFDYLRTDNVVVSGENGYEPAVRPGMFMEFEIIYGNQPNTICYPDSMRDSLYIFRSYPDIFLMKIDGNKGDDYLFTGSFEADNTADTNIQQVDTCTWAITSEDGINLTCAKNYRSWEIRSQIGSGMNFSSSSISRFFNNKVRFANSFDVSVRDILSAKLTERPDFITETEWDTTRAEIKAEIKERREFLRASLQELYNGFSTDAALFFARRSRTRKAGSVEGLVIQYDDQGQTDFVKLVDKSWFAELNEFTHIVRYWLIGGRRPARPCFWSRTADWDPDRRLARLEVLRKRYLAYADRLTYIDKRGKVYSYSDAELNERVLSLFAELRQRIEDGRHGVQGQSTQDLEIGDSANAEMASG